MFADRYKTRLSRPLEIIMLTRRIVISACALCLAVPAAAGASPATDPPKAEGPPGITTPTDPQHVVKAKGPYGATAPDPQNVVKAKGPYGATVSTNPQTLTGSTTHAASASSHDNSNDWRTAAIVQAALLAALALVSVLLLSARHRATGLAT
jgi:hypothetical protein